MQHYPQKMLHLGFERAAIYKRAFLPFFDASCPCAASGVQIPISGLNAVIFYHIIKNPAKPGSFRLFWAKLLVCPD